LHGRLALEHRGAVLILAVAALVFKHGPEMAQDAAALSNVSGVGTLTGPHQTPSVDHPRKCSCDHG